MRFLLLSLLTVLSISCNSQANTVKTAKNENSIEHKKSSQIGEYVVETFQDSKGSLWFGTLEKGVAKYDGNKLIYLTVNDGLPSNRIVSIIEDDSSNLWFGTGAGLSKFDGKSFTNFSEKDGLCSDRVSNLFIDSRGTFWIGTWGGVCTFDGSKFEIFNIPYPHIETQINKDTKDWITSITEDAAGNIWFGRDGYGACKFNGKAFVHLTTKEGLNSINVQSIVPDNKGNIWIGTRVSEKDNADAKNRFGRGGLNKYDGKMFKHFPEREGLSENDVYTIYRDQSNDLWFGTTSNGIYKLEKNEFVKFDVPNSTMSFLKDKSGNIWLGCAGGLFRLNKDGKIINITTSGPWN